MSGGRGTIFQGGIFLEGSFPEDNFLGGSFPWEQYSGGNFPRGIFPSTLQNILFLVKILYTTSFMMKSVEVITTPSPIKNQNDVCIGKNVNYVKSTIRQDEITIHPNSNFDNITDANITAINEENEINSISKVTILNDLVQECKAFLERVQKFDSNIEK